MAADCYWMLLVFYSTAKGRHVWVFLVIQLDLMFETHQFPKTEQCKCFHLVPAPCALQSWHSWHFFWTWVGADLLGAPVWPSVGAFWQKWGHCLGGLEMSWCSGICADLLYTADQDRKKQIKSLNIKISYVGEEKVNALNLTDPGLGSGTFPVYSLHFESCTSMYGPSKTFCTSEKAYWQIADALIFFLKDNPPYPKDMSRGHSQD